LTLLLIGMSVIMLTTLTGGWLARKVGQSRVVGEIVGGILLGPSAFGRLAPNAANSLFPKSSFAVLEILSTVGLILFLFLIGMELDHELLYRQRKTALLASGMSIPLPFATGRCWRPRCGFVSPHRESAAYLLHCSSALR
jgi:Kef-type K+ transport system membrane component KefB